MACADDVFLKTDNWGEQIRCLREEITNLKGEIQGATQAQGEFNSKLGSSFTLYKSIGASVNSLKKDMLAFTTSAQRQYDLAEKIAESYKEASLNIGLSVGRSKDFNQQFKLSVAEVARFGGNIQDVQGIYEDFAQSSGRVRILGKDEVANIYKLSKAANLAGSEAASLYETLDLMGVSNADATDRLEQVIKDSQEVGLNSSKVVKTLSNNMNKMQTYSFSSGVKGMTKMAQLAVTMRMDVGEMLGMADKFYQPEAAIEAAANLQMLGGDIAEAFGDPFETMYLARNKPEELAEKVSSMVENMMTFNEETGQYDFPAEARMQLKAAGDQLGINVDSMIEMTRQSAKMKDVKEKLSSMPGMFSDKEMEGISNMARMEDGEFKVDMYDEEGQKLTKSLDELNKSDVKMLMQSPQNEEDYMDKMIDNSMTSNELLKAINDSFQKTFVGGVDMYEVYEEGSKETIKAVREMTVKSTTASIDIMKDKLIGEMGTMGVNSIKALDENMAEAIKGMTSFIDGGDEFNIDSDTIDVQSAITNVNTSGGGKTPVSNVNLSETPEDRCKGKGGVLDSNGKCIKGGKEVAFAKGGIVTKPTRALIGEGGESEAVFPLSKLDKFINTNNTSSEMKVSGSATININIKSDNPSLDISSLKDTISRTVTKMFNNGGQPDGAYLPQEGGSNVLQS